ncbi:unnamed protein product, partial [Mesorhabditis belari]|uniref:Sodium/potassium-transporting ATPase subunit beta-3 n=1 Tax=Mesorhabditis belari TaxID=2138241 RepID=A0AAF3FKP3_9BILA
MAKKDNNAIEENNALMANGRQQAKPMHDETFRQFLYNKERGTCLGRDAKSWAQITIFYVIFYAILAAFWIGCLWIFLSTLDEKTPRFYGKGTIIGVNPGLGYQPWIKENPDSTLIQFNLQDASTYKPYVEQMKEYLKKYQKTNGTRTCTGSESNKALQPSDGSESALPCEFRLKVFDEGKCSEADAYGYKSGKPCVILSLNRLIGWQPVDYPANSVPKKVQGRYRNGSIAIHCDGTNDIDKEHIGKLSYLPPEGIEGKYYPYSFVENYHQPIAMVRFDTLPRNKLVLVECRAYALNIEHDITSRLGLVHFEVFVQDKKPEAKKEL